MRTQQQARYIALETVRIGDLIRVSWMVKDCEMQRIGVVAKRNHHHGVTEWSTAAGYALVARLSNMVAVDPTVMEHRVRITLLKSAEENLQVQLEGITL